MEVQFDPVTLGKLQNAVRRFPQEVIKETGRFITKGLAVYRQGINRSPWTVSSGGGGVPVDTGNLRDTHLTQVSTWEASIRPTAPYAESVHRGRPWLDYVAESKESDIRKLEIELLENIIKKL